MPGKESYHVAFVGTGNIARPFAQAVHENPLTELVALADIRPEAMNAFLSHYQQNIDTSFSLPASRLYTDYHEMLKDSAIDIVYVATYPDTIPVIAAEALEAGKHVFCEKPIGLPHELDKVVRLAQAVHNHPELVFAVDFIYYGEPGYMKPKEWIDQGKLGKINRYCFHKTNEFNTNEKARQYISTFFNMGAHPLFTGGSHPTFVECRYTKGKTNITHVDGHGTKPDKSYPCFTHEVGVTHFEDESVSEKEISWLDQPPGPATHLFYDTAVFGNEGTVVYDPTSGSSTLWINGEPVETTAGKKGRHQRIWNRFVEKIARKATAIPNGPDLPTIDDALDVFVIGAATDKAIYSGRPVVRDTIRGLFPFP